MLNIIFAIKSLFRHRTRSLISLGAIIFGQVALLLSGGFIAWNLYGMRTATIYSLLGHLQVARSRFFTDGVADPFAFLLPDEPKTLGALQSITGVRMVLPRLTVSGLVSRGDTTVSFLGEGLDAQLDLQKNLLIEDEAISRFINVSKGDALSANDPKGVILGEGLAANLGVTLGDKIVLLVSTASGGMNAVEANVRGLFFTLSKAYNDVALRMPIGLARDLLRVSGSHIWMVMLDESETVERVVARMQHSNLLGKERFEFKSWRDLADFYNKTERLYVSQMAVLFLIIGLIVVLSISNITRMNVLERTGEIGTLMAVGTRRRKIMMLFLNEGAALGISGSLIGLMLGILLAWLISKIGIPMPPAPGMSHSFVAEILITPTLAVASTLTALGTVLLATIYPAWKASRLNIVDALRHNR